MWMGKVRPTVIAALEAAETRAPFLLQLDFAGKVAAMALLERPLSARLIFSPIFGHHFRVH